MTAEYQKLLSATRSILASTKPAASKAEQTDRVRSLIQQAEAARPKDLAAALQLIQRANVLARDLARP
jgi:anti-sigma factor ChrR (cupin superfamily)